MSAWIVSKAHIDALVTAAFEYGLPPGDASATGYMLWRENHKSVNTRYNQRTRTPAYIFQRRAVPLTPVEVIKSIHCLDYQSCEHKGWKKSEARKFLQTLESYTVGRLPGYNAAPWGII